MFQFVWLLLLRVSSFHLPPNFSTVGSVAKGSVQRALPCPLQISVTQNGSLFVTRVPPARVSVLVKLWRLYQSGPDVWRMVHSHEPRCGRVATQSLATPPASLWRKPRSSESKLFAAFEKPAAPSITQAPCLYSNF